MAGANRLTETGARIEGLLDELGTVADPLVSGHAEELVRLLVELYGSGLQRVLEIVGETPQGRELVERLTEDKLVEGLLILHGLHPVPVEERIHRALEQVRPYLGSHAGGVEFQGVDEDGVAHLRLEGSCHGCPSSTVTVKLAIERAIQEAAPEVVRLEVQGTADPPPASGRRMIELRVVGEAGAPPGGAPAGSGDGWTRLVGLAPLPPGSMLAMQVEDMPVLLCSAQGSMYAYRNACARCGSALEGGHLEGDRLTCPSCGYRYDVRLAGRGLDDSSARLEPLPLLPESGGWKVAIPSGVRG